MTITITDEDRAIYERDGVVCIRGLGPLEWIERLRQAVDELIATPSEFSRDLAVEGGKTGSFFQQAQASKRHPVFDGFIHESPVAEAGADHGVACRAIFADQLLVKEPGNSAETSGARTSPTFRPMATRSARSGWAWIPSPGPVAP